MVVLGVEKRSILQLQDPRTVRKVVMLDDHVCLAFAGMQVSSTLSTLSLTYFPNRIDRRWSSFD